MLQHRHAFDFKAITYNGSDHLTFALGTSPNLGLPIGPDDLQLGIIADSTYEIHDKVDVNRNLTTLDIHEFNVVDDGKIALMTTTKIQLRDVSEVGVEGLRKKRVANKGFQEIEVATGKINFEWDALENGVSLTESYNVRELGDPSRSYWDFL
jgi:Arylsulfotransferase (ASST)